MTHIEIARRFAGISAAQLADRLGVSPQQMSNWTTGLRTPTRKNAAAMAEALDVDAAWLLDVEQRLAVIDRQDVYHCGIIRTEDIPGYGALYHVYLSQTGDIVPVILAGGVQMTPTDWQTLTVRSAADIPNTRWMDTHHRDAVMLDNLPRILFD